MIGSALSNLLAALTDVFGAGEPRACRTGSAPMIAAWAWSGDIGWDGFSRPAPVRPSDCTPCAPDL